MNDREFPYKQYKARFRMMDVVETVLTLDRKDSTGAFFFCPFHADGENGNLHVKDSEDHVTCFSGGCRFEGGDIFDFLTAYFEFSPDTSHIDCVRYLDGGRILQDEWQLSNDDLARILRGDFKSASVKKSAVRTAKPKEFQIAPAQNFDHMKWYEANLEHYGADYWLGRGLTYDTMRRFHLGYDPETHRHVIPNCNHVGVYGFKRRRDDAWAKADMRARGERWLNAEKDGIWQRRLARADALSHVLLAHGGHAGAQTGLDPLPPTDEDVFKKNYPKFIWGKTGENTMWLFNEDRLLNGKLLYVFLTSAEVDTITLEQFGYPSVAWASDTQFPEAQDIIFYSFQGKRIKLSIRDVFRSALHIYIVADNDASGLASARKRREALGRGDIISTPSEKDVNDYCRQHTIADWLPNVPPLLS
jgi:hypothetical protein